MKIYKVHMVLTLVISRLKKYDLEDYNSASPIIFVEANDPDDACYKAMHKLAQTIIKQDKNAVKIMTELFNDIRIKKVWTPK